MPRIVKTLFVATLAFCSGATVAASWPEGYLLAGEIILAPTRNGSGGSAASSENNRDRARAYQSGSSNSGSGSVVVPEEEEGLLSPRGATSPADNRAKARDYLRGVAPPGSNQVLIAPEQHDAGTTETARGQLEKNRSKARAYMKSDSSIDVVGVGADKLPVVVCRDIDNVSGRIGDDSQSGNIITITRDGRSMKARCK